jgi:hypothetical protein
MLAAPRKGLRAQTGVEFARAPARQSAKRSCGSTFKGGKHRQNSIAGMLHECNGKRLRKRIIGPTAG